MEARRRYQHFIYDSARWEGLAFREGDIVISTPPKCGTTWMQMLCALLIFRTPDLPAPLAELSPWIDMQLRPIDDVLAQLDAQTHRRFLKTHTPLDGIPFASEVTYLLVARDPRDVALSWDNHMDNIDFQRFFEARVAVGFEPDALATATPPSPPAEDPLDRFWQWVNGESSTSEVSSLPVLVHHVQTFWEQRHEPNVHLFHYADMRADRHGQMARLANILGTHAPTTDLVDAAGFEQMKARADELVPNSDTPFWNDTGRFFDKARSEGWRTVIDDDGLRRYEAVVNALASSDVVSWLHAGGAAAS